MIRYCIDTRMFLVCLTALLIPFWSCSSKKVPVQSIDEGTGSSAAEQPAATSLPKVNAERTDLIFRYLDQGSRRLLTATTIDEVPESARDQVVVVDSSVREPVGGVFVVDLRRADDNQLYPVRVVTAHAMDEWIRNKRPQASTKVRFYSASWCGACNKARAFLKKKGIPYVEKDVEKDSGARKELAEAASNAGVSPDKLSSVPIFIVGGRMLFGFDPKKLAALASQ